MTTTPQSQPAQPQTDWTSQPQAPRKRRRWPWVVGGVFALLVVIGIAGGGGEGAGSGVSRQPAPAGAPAAIGSQVVYQVESVGGHSALITYAADESFNIAQENGATLPWTKAVDVGGGFFGGTASLSAQGDQSTDTITCRVSRGGEVVSENTSTGPFAVVTCSGF